MAQAARPEVPPQGLRLAPAQRAERRSTPSVWARAAGLLLSLAALTWLVGCRNIDAAAHNLRVLHEPDGTLARRSAPLGHWEYRWRSALSSLPIERLGLGTEEPGGLLSSKAPRDQRYPSERVRRELRTLLKQADRNERTRGLAVEISTWLAVDDPSPVVRQMAIEELGRAADRLGVRQLEESVDDAEEAEALREALVQLFDQFEARDSHGFQRALGEVSRVVSSREGAWRALRGLNVLLGAPEKLEASRREFDATHAELQRRCVALGLSDALRDPDDLTRAEALRAALELAPSRVIGLLEESLGEGRLATLAAGLDAARRAGQLPAADERPELERWCELCVRSCDLPHGPAAVAATRALEVMAPRLDSAGAPAGTLRPEVWFLWWSQREAMGPAVPPGLGSGVPTP